MKYLFAIYAGLVFGALCAIGEAVPGTEPPTSNLQPPTLKFRITPPALRAVRPNPTPAPTPRVWTYAPVEWVAVIHPSAFNIQHSSPRP